MRLGPNTLEFSREKWLESRTKGVGCSELGALFALDPERCSHPQKSEYDLWLEKRAGRRKGAKSDETPDQKRGRILEEAVLRFAEEQLGVRLLRQGVDFAIPIVRAGWLGGSPDSLLLDGMGEPIYGVEAKTAAGHKAKLWGEPGTDQIPLDYALQCHGCMALTDAKRWYCGVLIGGSRFEFRLYTIERDEQICQSIRSRVESWWTAHILNDEEPKMTGAERGKWTLARYPVPTQSVKTASKSEAFTVACWRERERYAEEAEEEAATLRAAADGEEGNVISIMGPYERMEVPTLGTLYLKATRGGRKLTARWNEE